MHSCSDFVHWRQEGFVGSAQGTLQFFGINDALLLTLRLVKRNGLYFCPINSFANDIETIRSDSHQFPHIA